MTHMAVENLSNDLNGSQAQVKELQNRMQTAEAQEETLARQAGMTKKELAQRTAAVAGAAEGRGNPPGERAESADQRGERRNRGRED